MAKERHREKERKRDRKGETLNHLSIHQWVRSAIFASHQRTSRIGFPFLKLPPPPCAVLLVYNVFIQEPSGNSWIWSTKTSKKTQEIIAHLIGTATIASTSLKSFAQWYGLKSKESLLLWSNSEDNHLFLRECVHTIGSIEPNHTGNPVTGLNL